MSNKSISGPSFLASASSGIVLDLKPMDVDKTRRKANVLILSLITKQYGGKVDLRGTVISVHHGMFSFNLTVHIGRYKGHPTRAVCLIHCHTIFVTGMCQFDQSLHVFFYYTW
jgi:hypothetical protein